MNAPLKAPFPWFGGKSRVSHLVWNAFGDVANYVEPFAGSLAVLLGRPHTPRIETVNDLDCYLANFWRAVKYSPEEVAKWADWPVNEIDLHARHRWLVAQAEFRERMRGDPEYFDARVAGWWVWGICQWIGGGWCAESNWNPAAHRPAGDKTAEQPRRPKLYAPNGVHSKRRGDRTASENRRPQLHNSNGVHKRDTRGASATWNKRPSLGKGERGVQRTSVYEWMLALAERLRRVRVCCGDWTRVLGRSSTELIGVTGVFLDPPYLADFRDPSLYGTESPDVAHAVREWALKHGKNKKLRIALCGYEGEHEMPKDWQCVAWKAAGGYAAAAGNTENSAKERIWFSPHCERAHDQADLFGGAA
jgi:site-specific DNA-adenine methylase